MIRKQLLTHIAETNKGIGKGFRTQKRSSRQYSTQKVSPQNITTTTGRIQRPWGRKCRFAKGINNKIKSLQRQLHSS
jgi:hypothetical protein